MLLGELQDHLREVCGVRVSTATIARTLRWRGFTMKQVCLCSLKTNSHCANEWQVTRPAIERDEGDRAAYKMLVGEHFCPAQLVFADESHFNRLALRQPFAWAPWGSRAR
jgi:hypothetical protein